MVSELIGNSFTTRTTQQIMSQHVTHLLLIALMEREKTTAAKRRGSVGSIN